MYFDLSIITVLRPLSARNLIIWSSLCRFLISFCSPLISLTGSLWQRLVEILERMSSLV